MSSTNVLTPPLHHVNLKTTRLQELIDWYGTVAGLKPTYQFEGGAWLTNDGANHRLALLSTPAMKDDPEKLVHTGIHHIAFEFADINELLDTYVRLKGEGIVPHACLDHGMTTSFYYEDPDGNSVEMQADNFGDWKKSTEFMHGPDFAAEPIGVYVDPDKMVGARDAGAARDELHQRAYTDQEFAPDHPHGLRELHVP